MTTKVTFSGNYEETHQDLPLNLTPQNLIEHINTFITQGSDQAISFCYILVSLARIQSLCHNLLALGSKKPEALMRHSKTANAEETLKAFIEQMNADFFKPIDMSMQELKMEESGNIPVILTQLITPLLTALVYDWALECHKDPYQAIINFHDAYRSRKGIIKEIVFHNASAEIARRKRRSHAPKLPKNNHHLSKRKEAF